ncbi:MAG: polyprenyl synthetase family protein [Propionibacteriaceae bacterium]|nr:polyprenyl synthetase family protein [Propionibacteriaceae bacterium]
MVYDASDPLSARFSSDVDSVVSGFTEQHRQLLRGISAEMDLPLQAANNALGGGKRLRPAFAWWGYVATAGEPRDAEALLRAVSSLELLHAGLLVHDDLIDDSPLRRGQPAAHISLSGEHGESFGRSAAVLLGAQLLLFSAEMYDTSGLESAALDRGRRILELMRTEVLCGQYLDLLAEVSPPSNLREARERAESVLRYKTASYTVQRPVQLGAVLAGAETDVVDQLGNFGIALGKAFQLRDDVLGVFGEPATTGKSVTSDIQQGKRTLLIVEALRSADPQSGNELERQLGNPDADTERARQLITASGALDHIEQLIARYHQEALAILDNARVAPEARRALTALANRSVMRDR